MTVSNIMVQTVVTSKHEDYNLVFTNHGKEDGIYPLKRDSKSTKQRSIIRIYCKNMQNNQNRICVFNLLKI
jgi:hypothetical protein